MHTAEGLVVPDTLLTALRDAARATWQDFDVSQPSSLHHVHYTLFTVYCTLSLGMFFVFTSLNCCGVFDNFCP